MSYPRPSSSQQRPGGAAAALPRRSGNDNDSLRVTPERLYRSPEHVELIFYKHLSSPVCSESIKHLLATDPSTTSRDYSITIDSFDLINSEPVLGPMLLRSPATLLPQLEKAVVRAQREMLRQLQEEQGPASTATMSVKGGDGCMTTRLHARLVHLPPFCFQPSIGQMEACNIGSILQVTGTVVRTGPIQMYEATRTYACQGPKGCGQKFDVHADMELRNNPLQPPQRCPHFLPGTGQKCQGSNIQQVRGSMSSVHTDYQEIKIQESASRLGVGHIPRSLLVKLQHDLVDTCQPGDEVVIVGILLAQWQQNASNNMVEADCPIGMAMSAHSVRVVAEKGSSAWKSKNNANNVSELDKFRKDFEVYWATDKNRQSPIAARDFIVKAVCPKLYGLAVIKLALLVTLIGGVSADAYQQQQDDGNNNQQQQDSQSNHHKDDDDNFMNGPDPFYVATAMDTNATSKSFSGNMASALQHGTSSSSPYSQRSSRDSSQQQQQQQQQQVQTRRRDQSHLLLVGDPGTGKSQILRFAAALCPRSVLTTGVGTTSAGLTCAAVREGNAGEFGLEAGALVLADKGVCCIDEFGCIRAADRTTIHEAMEQQTLSVAKAGIVCKLNCRATIIAVMNPRDCLYDNHASLAHNTGLGTPLLSRFDLIFKLVDASDADRDSKVTTYLLQRAIQGAGFDANEEKEDEEEPLWSLEKLRAYISIVKEKFQPIMSDEAATLLERHYEKCRSCSSNNTIPRTVRFLESLIRLSQAHARLMFHNTVTLEDGVAVIRLMECSAFCYGGFDIQGVDDFNQVLYCDPMTIDFSSQPDTDFCCFEYRVLQRYNLLNHMDESRQKIAMQVLGGTSGGGRQTGGGGGGAFPDGNNGDRSYYPGAGNGGNDIASWQKWGEHNNNFPSSSWQGPLASGVTANTAASGGMQESSQWDAIWPNAGGLPMPSLPTMTHQINKGQQHQSHPPVPPPPGPVPGNHILASSEKNYNGISILPENGCNVTQDHYGRDHFTQPFTQQHQHQPPP